MDEASFLAGVSAGHDAVPPEADLVCLGEMGIGNTTAAAAIAAALFGGGGTRWAGRGTGIDDAGLDRKRAVVDRALACHADAVHDPLMIAAALGGRELAAILGATLAARRRRIQRLGRAGLGQRDVQALLRERRHHHEDDEQHQHHVDEGRDVDVGHGVGVRGLGGLVGMDDPLPVPGPRDVGRGHDVVRGRGGERRVGVLELRHQAPPPSTLRSAMSATSSTPASRQRSMTFMTSVYGSSASAFR